jgi:shikimate kinase
MRKIILIGYMGSGKSTIAHLLARKMNLNCVDLDNFIEKEAQESIKSIFDKGEIYFRKLEHQLFKKLVENEDDLIISTGGGTPCYANNHSLMNGDNVISIYLKGSIETLSNRLQKEKNHRPLVANLSDTELTEYIAKSLFERSYFYNKATFKVAIDDKSPEAITKEILQWLH